MEGTNLYTPQPLPDTHHSPKSVDQLFHKNHLDELEPNDPSHIYYRYPFSVRKLAKKIFDVGNSALIYPQVIRITNSGIISKPFH